jgi:hypothetical protein
MESSANFLPTTKKMKPIKNNTELVAAKLKLRVKELELEKVLQNDWQELREKLKPKSILKNVLHADDKEASKKN